MQNSFTHPSLADEKEHDQLLFGKQEPKRAETLSLLNRTGASTGRSIRSCDKFKHILQKPFSERLIGIGKKLITEDTPKCFKFKMHCNSVKSVIFSRR